MQHAKIVEMHRTNGNELHKALAIIEAETGKVLNYRQLMQSQKHKLTWSKFSANEYGRLANGEGGCTKGTNTIKFINKGNIPSKRMKDVTYEKNLCLIRPVGVFMADS
jgi:hypothetical protein